MAWHALSARFRSACLSRASSALRTGTTPDKLRAAGDAAADGVGLDQRQDVLDEQVGVRRTQLEVLRPDEAEKPLDDVVQPPDFAGDHLDVLVRAFRVGDAEQMLPHQLEMDRHRVQRILHFVRQARHQPAERAELARIVGGVQRPRPARRRASRLADHLEGFADPLELFFGGQLEREIGFAALQAQQARC